MTNLNRMIVRFLRTDGSYTRFERDARGYISIIERGKEFNNVVIPGSLTLFNNMVDAFEKEGVYVTKEVTYSYNKE